jgi:hypothetical protein
MISLTFLHDVKDKVNTGAQAERVKAGDDSGLKPRQAQQVTPRIINAMTRAAQSRG